MSYLRSVSFSAVLCGALLTTGASAASTDPFDYIPAGDQVIAAVNVRALLDSPLLATVRQQFESGPNAQQLGQIETMLGVDVLSDIDRIVVFGNLADESTISVAIGGRFDVQRINQAIDSFAHATRTPYGTTELIGFSEGDIDYASFPNTNIALFGSSQDRLRTVIDTSEVAHAAPDYSSIADRVGRPDEAAIWFSVNKPDLAQLDEDLASTGVKLENLVGAIHVDPTSVNMNCLVEFGSPENSKQVGDMARGLLAFGAMQNEDKDLKRLVSLLRIEQPAVDSPQLRISAAVPEDLVKQAIAKAQANVDTEVEVDDDMDIDIDVDIDTDS